MQRVLVFLMVSLLAAGSACGVSGARFAVLADPHFYNARLGTEGAAFEEYLAGDRKMLRESEAILEAALDGIRAAGVDFVVVCGDLTKDGALASHLRFARRLEALEASGIEVFVVPGNHDINNPHACAYFGPLAIPVHPVAPSLFERIYKPFGYGEAVARDRFSLSYVAEPAPGVRLLALDSCIYKDNLAEGHPETGGRFEPRTLNWIVDQLDRARRAGCVPLAAMHHGVLEHFEGQSALFGDYVIEDWERVSETLAGAGLRVVFTGHFHAHDVTRRAWGAAELYDVETGSLVTYPSPYRLAGLQADGALTLESRYVTAIDYDLGGVPFPEYAEAFVWTWVDDVAHTVLRLLTDLPADEVDFLSAVAADTFVAHYEGDETPAPEAVAAAAALAADPQPLPSALGSLLLNLMTDLPPADAALTVPAGPCR
ncbi:MAG: metallophosphoesterase [Lentisphaerae bacterium]|nr:metallophosphoesterase [Lentisphaerota bacterium]